MRFRANLSITPSNKTNAYTNTNYFSSYTNRQCSKCELSSKVRHFLISFESFKFFYLSLYGLLGGFLELISSGTCCLKYILYGKFILMKFVMVTFCTPVTPLIKIWISAIKARREACDSSFCFWWQVEYVLSDIGLACFTRTPLEGLKFQTGSWLFSATRARTDYCKSILNSQWRGESI